MKNVLLLLKVGLKSSFTFNGTRRKRRIKAGAVGATAALGGLLFMAVVAGYGLMLSTLCDMANTPELLLTGGLVLGMLMSLITGIAKTPGSLFAAKDFEMLSALPVTDSELFLSKLALVYSFNLTGMGSIALPFALVYGIKYGASFGFYPALIAALLILPMLVGTVSGVISLFISRISSKSRAGNFFMLVLSMAFIVLVMIGSMSMSSVPEGDMIRALGNFSASLRTFVPTGLFASSVLGDYANLLLLLLLCGVPFGLFAALSAGLFKQVNIAFGEKRMRGNFKTKRLRKIGEKSVSGALFSRELRGYFSFYGYVMNTGVGALMALIFTGILLFGGASAFTESISPDVGETVVLPLFICMLCFCGLASPPTAAGISMEGNRLWILRSLPVSAKDIFAAKLKLQLMLMWPVSVICGVVAALVLKTGVLGAAAAVAVPMAYALFAGLAGLVINLNLPMLDWKNPMVPIKRSASVIVCMLVDFAALALPTVIYILTGVNFLLFAALVFVIIIAASAVMWNWLKTGGSRKLYSL